MPRRILVLGQISTAFWEAFTPLFARESFECGLATSVACAPAGSASTDLVVLVASGEPREVSSQLLSIRSQFRGRPVLAVLPECAQTSLIRAASETADDFILAPLRGPELVWRVGRILGGESDSIGAIADRLADELAAPGLVGRDPEFTRALDRIPSMARVNAPVLITGETGTGKELMARAIHTFSKRREFPFIPVDCAGIPEHLFENELFGHARGAFTDARNEQKGLVGMADGGTLFLDEIDSLPLRLQSKLLRFLQERTYRRLGSDKFVHANVKLVTATNKDIEQLVQSGQFRADLLFRLDVLRLPIPPLRKRPADIPLLARHFVAETCQQDGLGPKTLTQAALQKLEAHSWPGNVRELYNVIQSAVMTCDGRSIAPHHLERITTASASEATSKGSFREGRAKAIESFERSYVERVLRECDGNVTQAARVARKERRAFGRLVKRYQTKARLSELNSSQQTGSD